MRYKAICFDIDGTLYPASLMKRRLMALWARHPAFSVRYNRERREFRRCQADFRQSIPFRWREAMIIRNASGEEPKKKFSEADYRATYDRLQKYIYAPMQKLYERTKPFDGVVSTFSKIKNNGLKIGVFTDFPLFSKLQGMGLADLVDFAASSDDTGFLKPDAHCFGYLLYNLKLGPKDVLYVGDSYSKDIAGASGAGIDAVLVNVAPSHLEDAATLYPQARAVFSTWDGFDRWLTAEMEDD